MRTILAIIFMTFAAHASAEELSLVCETTSEVFHQSNSKGETTAYDDTITNLKTEILFDGQSVEASFPLFKAYCKNFDTQWKKNDIESFCFENNTSSSIKISRLTGLVKYSFIISPDDGSMSAYFYKGQCKKSKKMF